MIHTQYPNRIEVTHPDGAHRDQTVQLPLHISHAKRRVTRMRPTFAAKVAKGFTVRVVLADELVETHAPDTAEGHADYMRRLEAERLDAAIADLDDAILNATAVIDRAGRS